MSLFLVEIPQHLVISYSAINIGLHSRISNKSVLIQASQPAYSRQLLNQQLKLFGRIARAPDEDVLRVLTFMPGTLRAATHRYVRKQGRPRNEWADQLLKQALQMCGSLLAVQDLIQDDNRWSNAVRQFCYQ